MTIDSTLGGYLSPGNTDDVPKSQLKAALDQANTDIAGVTVAASAVTNTPAGNIAATTVQAAIDELDAEKQPLDATLTALAAFNTNGLLTQTAADTFTGRTLTGPAAGISVSNGDGVSGNPTLALTNDLSALEGLASTGIAVRSASDTWVQRSIAGGTDVTVNDGNGVSGNPTVTLDANVARLATAQEYTAAQNFNATTLSDGATISWDASANQVASVTLGGNRTLGAPTNLKDGATYILIVKQDGTGSRTLSYNAVFKFPGGTAPTLTTTASATDILVFVSDGTNMFGVDQLDFS